MYDDMTMTRCVCMNEMVALHPFSRVEASKAEGAAKALDGAVKALDQRRRAPPPDPAGG